MNEIHKVQRFAPSKAFFFVLWSLENYFEFRTTNVRVKMDLSVSLRWIKGFEHFQRGLYFSDNCAFNY